MPGDFRDLHAWQEAIKLVAMVVPLLEKVRGPGASDLADQIARAAGSVHSNIAEGHSKGFGPDNARFLRIAMASAAEVETRLEGAVASQRLPNHPTRPVIDQARRARALTAGLSKHVEARHRPVSRRRIT